MYFPNLYENSAKYNTYNLTQGRLCNTTNIHQMKSKDHPRSEEGETVQFYKGVSNTVVDLHKIHDYIIISMI